MFKWLGKKAEIDTNYKQPSPVVIREPARSLIESLGRDEWSDETLQRGGLLKHNSLSDIRIFYQVYADSKDPRFYNYFTNLSWVNKDEEKDINQAVGIRVREIRETFQQKCIEEERNKFMQLVKETNEQN